MAQDYCITKNRKKMTKEEAINITKAFLDDCYENWSEASHYISETECDAIEYLIQVATPQYD